MRLINVSTLKFEEFEGRNIPEYGILSHTWGIEEVSLKDYHRLDAPSLKGYEKIKICCELAEADDLTYVWVDTCCIDKTSSAELSEAINSMYQWYERAEVCYAFLSDMAKVLIDPLLHPQTEHVKSFIDANLASLRNCRWFTRGWTLQELVASRVIKFYDADWELIGTKDSMSKYLVSITGIEFDFLWNPRRASVAQKMSWAAKRQTTREEDMAYCLLGLFDLNMPLLYGEGSKAFRRLQHEIIKFTDDESIFAWTNDGLWMSGLIANSPADFAFSGNIIPARNPSFHRPQYQPTNQGFNIQMVGKDQLTRSSGTIDFTLRCVCKTDGKVDYERFLVLRCKEMFHEDDSFETRLVRTSPSRLDFIPHAGSPDSQQPLRRTWCFFDDFYYYKPPQYQGETFTARRLQGLSPSCLQLRLRAGIYPGDIEQASDLPPGNIGFWIRQEPKNNHSLRLISPNFAYTEPILLHWSTFTETIDTIQVTIAERRRMRDSEERQSDSFSNESCKLESGDSMAITIERNNILMIALHNEGSQNIVDLQVERDETYKHHIQRTKTRRANYRDQQPNQVVQQLDAYKRQSGGGEHLYGVGQKLIELKLTTTHI